jgi:YkoY family integral membrane protein
MLVTPQDLAVIGFLVFLEGVLSIDNAIVLALLARPLPKEQQKKALTLGLVGAVVFRLVAIGFAAYLMQWRWVKFVGSGYLIWIALRHFTKKEKPHDPNVPKKKVSFWKTVLIIELTDIAFAVDSILAAVALSNKFWVVFTGGFIGVVLMRFAATAFLKTLERFPRFEASAYLLVLLIGVKLLMDGLRLPGIDFHSASSPAFWVFWGLMLGSILYGFKPIKKSDTTGPAGES